MRLSGLALLSLLAASPALADGTLEAYAPIKVVGIMPDTRQALVWDEAAAEYRVVKVGDTLEGWKVLDISPAGKRVTVAQDDMRDELSLTRLPRPNALLTYGNARVAPVADTRPAALPTPVPPTATVAPGPNAPIGTDMLASPGAAGAAAAPTDPYGPSSAATDASEPMDPYVAAAPGAVPAPIGAAVPVTPSQPTVIGGDEPEPELAVERHVLRRADLDREINDFDGLMATVQVAPLPRGGFAITRLDNRSWLASVGLRQGDRVRSIAGESVSTVDDAARVYARLRSASSFTVEVQRAQRRVLLHFDVR